MCVPHFVNTVLFFIIDITHYKTISDMGLKIYQVLTFHMMEDNYLT